jgi:DNA-binding LacI/PurR family transcriptional regulator
VSVSTVSNHINKKGRMGEETRGRIQAAMDALYFTPSALVRAIHQRRTGILGAVLLGLHTIDEDVSQSITPPVLRGISDGADATRRNLLLYTGWPHHREQFTGENFLDGHIDGLIWVAPELSEPAMERAAAAGLPIVALLTRHVPENVGYVNADNVGAMHALVAHLAALGHQRIAYFGPTHNSNYIDRFDGYRQALAANGLTGDPELEVVLPHEYGLWEKFNYPALDRLLTRSDKPTAIVAPDDGWAVWMIDSVRERGLRVPEDIAVTGFDDMHNAALVAGGLTSMRQPFREIGRKAVERLIALIDGAPVSECRVTLPTELIVRASTVGPGER